MDELEWCQPFDYAQYAWEMQPRSEWDCIERRAGEMRGAPCAC